MQPRPSRTVGDAAPGSATRQGDHGSHLMNDRSKHLDFQTWIAEIEAVVTFDIDAALWRKYFDAGLTPLEAIEQNRIDEEV